MYPIKISSTAALYRQDITINDKFSLTADEPLELVYAARKGWELKSVEVDVSHQKINRQYQISVRLHLVGNLTDDQRQRLLKISDQCPVHKLLQSEAEIETILAD